MRAARTTDSRPAVVLFTRDLRVHDNPALAAAVRRHTRVVPLFVVDDAVVRRFGAPNRLAFLEESLHDLANSLGGLVVGRGDTVDEAVRVARAFGAERVYFAEDASAFARERERRLSARLDVERFPSTSVVPLDALHTYRVFTPYWRAWSGLPRRELLGAPDVELADGVDAPTVDLVAGSTSPGRIRGGESEGRRMLDRFVGDALEDYEERANDLGADATSRLSPFLHFGCLSPLEVAERAPESDAFVRQLAWRDFFLQLLVAYPHVGRRDYRPRVAAWSHDEDALDAWRTGATGCAVVDAGMRQLAHEGWLPNRARLIVAGYLTKTLGVYWRHGAAHFEELLVDGDLASNSGNWQWVAGTGVDPRRNRRFNVDRQAARYDPDGAYVSRFAAATATSSTVPAAPSATGRAAPARSTRR